MRKLITTGLLGAALLGGGLAFAKGKPVDKPVDNVSEKKHPNLAKAQDHIEKAFDFLSKAQTANEFDLGGHAKKAKELLDEAAKEIKEAAKTANAK